MSQQAMGQLGPRDPEHPGTMVTVHPQQVYSNPVDQFFTGFGQGLDHQLDRFTDAVKSPFKTNNLVLYAILAVTVVIIMKK